MKLIIDIGGTHLRSRLKGDGSSIDSSCPTRDYELVEFIEEYLGRYPTIGFVGISFAGQVYNGSIVSSPNIRVEHKNIKEYLQQKYKNLRVEIDNDLNCAIRAESIYHKEEYISALFVGTGIGASLMDRGKIVRGYNNQSFEIGHIPYQKAPFRCGCGKDNCIELYASGLGIQRWLEYYSTDTTPNLAQLKRDRSPIADMFEDALLRAVATIITISNSKILVLGGGVVEKNPYLVEFIQESISTEVMGVSLDGVKILSSSLVSATLDGAELLE